MNDNVKDIGTVQEHWMNGEPFNAITFGLSAEVIANFWISGIGRCCNQNHRRHFRLFGKFIVAIIIFCFEKLDIYPIAIARKILESL